jgi:hypothetical protein
MQGSVKKRLPSLRQLRQQSPGVSGFQHEPEPGGGVKVKKAEREALRKELVAKGYVVERIAVVMMARYRVRVRLAFRWAAGMTLQDVADAWNQLERSGRAPMTMPRISEYERWPHGGKRPTAYVLLMLAKIWNTTVERLLDVDDYGALDDKQLFEIIELCQYTAQDGGETTPSHGSTPASASGEAEVGATRRRDVMNLGGLAVAGHVLGAPGRTILEQIEQAAAESAELAAWAGASNIDDGGLEQLHEEVRAIAHAYLYASPYPLLQRAERLRNQVTALLRGHQHPDQTRELYVLNAWLCALLAWMAGDLGSNAAARDHARAAWRCAERADHNGARAWVRATQSKTAFWDGDYGESARLARDGLRYTPSDSAAVYLALLEARAWGKLCQVGEANGALDRWRAERERVPGPDEVGGVLGVTVADQHYLAGSTYLLLHQPDMALAESHEAIHQFEATPDEQRFYGPEMLARIDAGLAELQGARLDATIYALQPVFAVPPERRLATIVQSLSRIRAGLVLPQYRGSAEAEQLAKQIDEYCSQAAGT